MLGSEHNLFITVLGTSTMDRNLVKLFKVLMRKAIESVKNLLHPEHLMLR